MQDNARYAAAKLTCSVMSDDSFGNLAAEGIFSQITLSGIDRAFASAIFKGTLSRLVNVDAVLGKTSSRSPEQTSPFVLAVLRNAVWQIMYSDQIPDHSAADEAVTLALEHEGRGAASYVNAVIRNITKHKADIAKSYCFEPQKFHLKCSMPPEIAGYFKKWFGAERGLEISQALHLNADISIRANSLKTDIFAVTEKLRAGGADVSPAHFFPDAALIRSKGKPVNTLPGFGSGDFTVQDEAAMLVSLIASPTPGDLVIDLCAAPGGKTCHMGELMHNKGEILAYDLNPARIGLIEYNSRRMGINIIKCRSGDAREICLEDTGSKMADLVLADVPCSGLGIIRRKPDIMLRMGHEKIISLYPLQKEILNNAARLVKTGGYLVYSTCTLNPEENDFRVKDFLEDMNGSFETSGFCGSLPEGILTGDEQITEGAKSGMITLFPDRHGCDGFFIAKLRRVR